MLTLDRKAPVVLDEDRQARIAQLGYDYSASPKECVNRCNLCGHDVFTALTHSDRYGYPARTAACQRCGLSVLSPRMTAAAYSEFYERIYRPLVSAYHGRLIDAETVEADQAGYTDALAEVLSPFSIAARNTASGRWWLDRIGRLTIRRPLRPTTADPRPCSPRGRARAGRGFDAVVDTMESFAPAGEHFGVALLCQTIHHLLDVAGSLARLRAVLTDDGILFVDIVDFRAAYLRAGSVEAATRSTTPTR